MTGSDFVLIVMNIGIGAAFIGVAISKIVQLFLK